MDIREATASDVVAMKALVETDFDADRLIRERTVTVAEEDGELRGFVSYDAWSGTVHVSTLVGDPEVVDGLLEGPRRFADREDLPVEIVVPDADEELQSAVTAAGFVEVGKGPRFEDQPTHRYRYTVE